MDDYQIAEILMKIDGDIWDDLGLDSRPSGDERVTYAETLLEALENSTEVYPDDITSDVIGILEDENFHSLCDVLSVFTEECDLEDILD